MDTRHSLLETLPDDVRRGAKALRVVEVGFGAGPGCVAMSIQRCDPPIAMEDALAYLEQYRSIWKRGHVLLQDGSRLWFSPVPGYVAAVVGR